MARPRDYSIPIEDMLAAIAGVRLAARDDMPEALAKDWVRMRAVERGFEISSEASRRLSEDLKAGEPGIPWKRIAGIGNVLRHDYDGIEIALPLTAMRGDLPALEAALRRMLARL
jgi:uncharacterized protein with HEPN domain